MKPQKHILVCTHERAPGDPRGSCSERGGKRVLDALRGELFSEELLDTTKATATGCLGYCAQGVTAVVYPDMTWYQHVQPEDATDIIEEHILDDEPVERLLIPEDQL